MNILPCRKVDFTKGCFLTSVVHIWLVVLYNVKRLRQIKNDDGKYR